MIIVVMGVAGSGKTTFGAMLADAMKCPFREGDSLHSKENIDKMSRGVPITWVYLKGSLELLRARLRHRPSHFMKADMLESQFATLEEPIDAVVADVSAPPGAIVQQILARLGVRLDQ
jgi:gluconokinase